MAGPTRLITLNLGSQAIALAEFRVAHGSLVLVNYRLRETPVDPETGQRRDAHLALRDTAAVPSGRSRSGKFQPIFDRFTHDYMDDPAQRSLRRRSGFR